MSKNQLDIAKLMAELLRVETRLPHEFPYEIVDWLIEQAERVQELEEESYNAHLERLLDRKEQQNKRYREALEFYEEGKHVAYCLYGDKNNDMVSDYGEEARQALEEN